MSPVMLVVVAQCGFVNGVNLCFWGLDGKGHGRNDEVHSCGLFWDLNFEVHFATLYFYLPNSFIKLFNFVQESQYK